MIHRNKNHKSRKFKVLSVVAIVILLVAGVVIFKLTSDDNTNPSESTKSLPTAQSDFTGDEVKEEPAKTPGASVSATDNNGSTSDTIPPSSQWTTSKDGTSITIYSPGSDSKFSTGDTVYGIAKTSTVSYELEDNVSGVIAQGTANVVRGKFSIDFAFSTAATSGNINVFNQDSQGVITNIVTVPVRFK